MSIILLIFIAALLYALFGFFLSKASGDDPFMVNSLTNGLSGLATLAIFAVLMRMKSTGPVTKQGVIYSVVAAVLIAAFSVLLVKIFGRGGNLSYVLPLIYGGVIVFGSVLGVLFLKESVAPLQLAGILVIVAGIAMVVLAKVHA
ncbi:MAG TPA: EamA family transporter [Candidatus Saccharimonadales bacterium]|jgi:drug/metabolite transporter (DMT)-like permease